MYPKRCLCNMNHPIKVSRRPVSMFQGGFTRESCFAVSMAVHSKRCIPAWTDKALHWFVINKNFPVPFEIVLRNNVYYERKFRAERCNMMSEQITPFLQRFYTNFPQLKWSACWVNGNFDKVRWLFGSIIRIVVVSSSRDAIV